MYSTEISINGKVIPIRFGSYVIERFHEEGLSFEELGELVNKNPVGMIKKIVYYGAINAVKGKDEGKVDVDDIYDWMDEVGYLSEEPLKMIKMFTESATKGVPKVDAQKKPAAKKK